MPWHSKQKQKKICCVLGVWLLTTISVVTVAWAGPEEEELVRIAQKLKSISDAQWNEILGPKINDVYEVQKGDNLWNVSKSLFGNPFYWPKVWSLNNPSIKNPHIIQPGQKLAFVPGSSTALPGLAGGDGTVTAGAKAVTSQQVAEEEAKYEHEYDKLSPDMWAPEFLGHLPSQYDDLGMDRDLKVEFNTKFRFRVPAIVNDTTLPYLGEIIGSRRDGVALASGEVVFVKSNGQELQVGSSYSIFAEPNNIREKKSDRSGFSYSSVGELRVIGVKDELYIAEITRAYDGIQRGYRIYPLLPLITGINPTPATAPIEGLVVIDKNTSLSNVSQYHFVFLDRGLEDGVQIGNVFRVYDYYDPITQKKITDSDFLTSADVIVVHATAQFSTGLVIRALSTISQGEFGVLLTDVSDLIKVKKALSRAGYGEGAADTDRELDELDELDRQSGEGLGRKEEMEIKQLDYWDKTKDLQPTVPSDTGGSGAATKLTPLSQEAPTLQDAPDSSSVGGGVPDGSPSSFSGPEIAPMEPLTPQDSNSDSDSKLDSNTGGGYQELGSPPPK